MKKFVYKVSEARTKWTRNFTSKRTETRDIVIASTLEKAINILNSLDDIQYDCERVLNGIRKNDIFYGRMIVCGRASPKHWNDRSDKRHYIVRMELV